MPCNIHVCLAAWPLHHMFRSLGPCSSQILLLVYLRTPPQHVFKKLEDFLLPNENNQKLASSIRSMTWSQIVRWVKQCKALGDTAECVACESEVCTHISCLLHVGGPPCLDWSPQGARGGSMGPTFVPTVLWLMQRRRYQERVVVHKHVPQFALQI